MPSVPVVPKSDGSLLPPEADLTVHVHHADPVDVVHDHVGFVFGDVVDPLGEAPAPGASAEEKGLRIRGNIPVDVESLPTGDRICDILSASMKVDQRRELTCPHDGVVSLKRAVAVQRATARSLVDLQTELSGFLVEEVG